jgi:hypothetical protein
MDWIPNTEEAALIATAVTLIGILITNQAKVSEFRQLWINALRDDASTLISHTLIVHAAHAGENIDESYLQIHQTTARIRLRLNPDEPKTKKVISAMNNMRDANHAETEFSVMNQRVDEFTKVVQNVLRSEWRRVKWGEPLYRVIFFLVTLGMLLSFGVILHKSYPWIFHFISGSM